MLCAKMSCSVCVSTCANVVWLRVVVACVCCVCVLRVCWCCVYMCETLCRLRVYLACVPQQIACVYVVFGMLCGSAHVCVTTLDCCVISHVDCCTGCVVDCVCCMCVCCCSVVYV